MAVDVPGSPRSRRAGRALGASTALAVTTLVAVALVLALPVILLPPPFVLALGGLGVAWVGGHRYRRGRISTIRATALGVGGLLVAATAPGATGICALAGGGVGSLVPSVEVVTGVVRVGPFPVPTAKLWLDAPGGCSVSILLDTYVAGYAVAAYGLAGDSAVVGAVDGAGEDGRTTGG